MGDVVNMQEFIMMNYAGIYKAKNGDVEIKRATNRLLWEDFKELYESGFWDDKGKRQPIDISFQVLMRCEPGLSEEEMWGRYDGR